jgi:TP901 family phage tail tape measure protein
VAEIGLSLRIRRVQEGSVRGLRRELRATSKEQLRSTKRQSTAQTRANKERARDEARHRKNVARIEKDARDALRNRERLQAKANRFAERALRLQQKRQRVARSMTLEGAKQTEQLREQRRLLRQQARRQLGLGPKGGRRFDPDAPATNLSIAAAATGRFARAGRTAISNLITDAGDLEKAIADVANLTTNIDEEQVIEAIESASVQFGTSQMNQVLAYYSAVSAGATTATEAQEVLNAANLLSIVGRSDQETAVLAVTKAVANFGEQGVDSAKAARSLFGAIQGGQLDATDLANAFPRVAKNAALAGLTMQETTATLAFFSRTMANADEAGTAFNQVLATIGKGATRGTKAFKEANRLGIDFSRTGVKAAGGWRPFIEDILENPKFNEQTMGRLFESKRARAAVDAMSGDLTDLTEITALASTESDALADGWERQRKTQSRQRLQAIAELEQLKLTAGRELLPVMVELGKALSPMIKDLSQFIKDNPWLAKVAVASVAGATVLSPVLQAMSVAAGLSGGRGFGMFAGAGRAAAGAGAAPVSARAALFGPQRTAASQLGVVAGPAGKAAGALSLLAVGAAAFFTGWEIGKVIDETLGLSEAFSRLADSPLIDRLNEPGFRTREEILKLGPEGLKRERIEKLEAIVEEKTFGGLLGGEIKGGIFGAPVKQARRELERERGGPTTMSDFLAVLEQKVGGQATIRVVVDGPGRVARTETENLSDTLRLEVDGGKI